MDKNSETVAVADAPATNRDEFKVRAEMRTSAAVLRLLDEVRCDELNGDSAMQCYDRAHNRHNR
jgi:hypothetical protein